MMRGILTFLTSSMIFVGTAGFAQKQQALPAASSIFLLPSGGPNAFIKKFPGEKSTNSLKPVPADFYHSGMGFFCRNELRLDRIMVVPIRFRLGSLEGCKRQEGYPNFR